MAKRTAWKLRPFIVGNTQHTTKTNKEDNKIIWVVDTNTRKEMKIIKNLLRFDSIVQTLLGNKKMKKIVKKKLGSDQLAELEDMLLNHTQLEYEHT